MLKEITIVVENVEEIIKLFGMYDRNIKKLENEFKVKILSREGQIKIVGDEENVVMTKKAVDQLLQTIERSGNLDDQKVDYIIDLVTKGQEQQYASLDDIICYTARGKQIKSKTIGQKKYVDLIKKNEVVFSIGPAGTGKTYLAMAMAVSAFKKEEVSRIILTRPAVEAGEKLGFLPGDLQDKVDPYLRPLYDALYEIMGVENYQKYVEKGMIEVAPLAYMRGRTLDNSFIILDEAQNTTPEQMKMFLTRLGFGSKAVITGDITQVDLPNDKVSGLQRVTKILKGIKGIEFIYLTQSDVVRHKLVQRIIKAYEKYETKKKKK